MSPTVDIQTHRPETAGQHLVTNVARGGASDSVGATLRSLRNRPPPSGDAVYVVDPDGGLVGAVPISALVAAPEDARLDDVMLRDPPRVTEHTDQERVALLAIRNGWSSMPVVAEPGGRFLGVVPASALLDVLRREHDEDVRRLAGIARETRKARHALEEPPARRVRHRLPWLLVGLAGSALSALLVGRFEGLLARHLQLAFFLPGIVYLADAIGTQTEAVAVRGLSISHRSIGRLLRDEMGAGFLIGALLGGVALPLVWLVMGDARIAVTVSVSLVGAGAVAASVGLLLPWALSRAGSDPAFGSGPIATIIQDVLSLLIFLSVSWLLMPR
jgi:magnesium transporter